jgi:hypothetical protein
MQKLQARENSKAIDADRLALEKPFGSAWAGSPSPKVTLVMFTDYSCGYCRASLGDVGQAAGRESGPEGGLARDTRAGPGQRSGGAGGACGGQGRAALSALHKGLFEAGRPDHATIAKVASSAGLDAGKLANDGQGQRVTAELASNMALAGRLGVSGTPAFVIGDEFLSGAVGYEVLSEGGRGRAQILINTRWGGPARGASRIRIDMSRQIVQPARYSRSALSRSARSFLSGVAPR